MLNDIIFLFVFRLEIFKYVLKFEFPDLIIHSFVKFHHEFTPCDKNNA